MGGGGGAGLFNGTKGASKGSKTIYPGNDPFRQPGKGYEWKGHPEKGSWYNSKTKEVLRPDTNHKEPIGPHWDYRAPNGQWYRIFPDGHMELK